MNDNTTIISDDDIINLELNDNGIYDVTEEVEDDKEIIKEHEFRAPVDEFVDGIFMGLNVSNFMHKVIRRII